MGQRQHTMWITLFIITLLVWFSETKAGGRRVKQEKEKATNSPLLPNVTESYPTSYATQKTTVSQIIHREYCEEVIRKCKKGNISWTTCYENKITTCRVRGRFLPNFIRRIVNSSQEAEVSPTSHHRVHIPSSALQRSRGNESDHEVQLVASLINSSFFELSPPRKTRGHSQPHMQGTVMGGFVLSVRAGVSHVENLPQPIKLIFKHDKQMQIANGTCVFWQESLHMLGKGRWSTDGCETNDTGAEFICSCNHLSFFAVLVNPVLSVDKSNAVALSYITYIGSALSVFFTIISLIIYICLQRRRPEKANGVHMQLTGALLCLHLSFLLCCLSGWLLKDNENSSVCQGLGLFLHWSLLATFSWAALEGFHLYLLLVRVFNIYVRRYMLKLSLVGWGLPTLTVVVCGILGVYGKYTVNVRDDNDSTSQICWMSSEFPQRRLVSYITTVAFPCLVVLYNSCMLGMVVFRIWGLRRGSRGIESTSSWKKMNKEKVTRLWKDCTTVLGLSCVLSLTWGLLSTTYISLPGIYVFTILNSLQGVFMFLWSVAMTRKSRSDNDSSFRDNSSSQKIMTTSFNN